MDIIKNKNPYILDTFIYNGISYPALTRKNADFVNAIIKLDSNYKDDFINKKPSDSFKLDDKSTHHFFSGSTEYWFNLIINSNSSNFKDYLYGLVIAIDRFNSTHLESSINGRIEMTERIYSLAKSKEELKRLLKNHVFDKLHPLYILSIPMKGHNGHDRCNLSFVSKFLNISFKYLYGDSVEDILSSYYYPKYDSVVSNILDVYANFYLNTTYYNKKLFNIHSSKDYDIKYKNIYNYSAAIRKILDLIYEDEHILIDDFDHIVWYLNKGKK